METEFPITDNATYFKSSDFQDNEVTLTYKGWERKANNDRMKDGKVVKSWVDCLDFCLKYSYPEWATDKAQRPILDEEGKPFRNRNYLPEYPQGYSIVYHFEEGIFESGSSPFWEALKRLKPKPGEKITAMKTGKNLETKWFVCRAADRANDDVPSLDTDEFGATKTLPF